MAKNKGMVFLEAALVLVVVMVGLLAMQVYLKRAYLGRLKDDTERIGDRFRAGGTYSITQKDESKSNEIVATSGATVKTIIKQKSNTDVTESY